MGNYLSKPITEKESDDGDCDKLGYGASAMQGWRTDQEDAHNCILDFDENSYLFAVYDGHGGSDVSKYCALQLPDFIKSVPDYKTGMISDALEAAFLDFDQTLKTAEVKNRLKTINGLSADETVEKNELDLLKEEACLPVHKVMAKYKNDFESANHQSPTLKAKKNNSVVNGDVNKADEKSGESNKCEKFDSNNFKTTSDVPDPNSSSECAKDTFNVTNGEHTTTEQSSDNDETGEVKPSSVTKESGTFGEFRNEPGCSSFSSSKSESPVSDSSTPNKVSSRLREKINLELLDSSDEEDCDSDEEYNEDEGIENDSEDWEDESDDEIKSHNTEEDFESSADDSSDDEDSERQLPYFGSIEPEPAEDTGCTACLALIKDAVLYVANVGDSRCIICRKGIAVEMSCDHKPEDEVETARIKAAGGEVTMDGRVNGGLNLSRALGDHIYKKSDLPAKEQMISAQPDVQTLNLSSDDEFLVVACDGIWNTMSSQEVVDFVKQKIDKRRLSSICEELSDIFLLVLQGLSTPDVHTLPRSRYHG